MGLVMVQVVLVAVQVVLVAVPVVAARPCTVRSVYTAGGGGA